MLLSPATGTFGPTPLPDCLVALIKSFLPKPPVPYVHTLHLPHYFSYDYMRVEDWNDTGDVRAYGDY